MPVFLIPWMEGLAVTLIGFLADAVVGLIGKALVGLGIGLVTTTGFNALFNAALTQSNISQVGDSQFQAAVTAMGIPWFISTIISAITTRMTLRGLQSDSLSAWRTKKQTAA